MEVIVTGQLQQTVASGGFTLTGAADTTLAPLQAFDNKALIRSACFPMT